MNSIENYKEDADLFARKTAMLKITDGSDQFIEYHKYILESLNMIKEFFPSKAHAWYQASMDCMSRSISVADAKKIGAEIRAYRLNVLGANNHMPDVKNQAEALTYLFQFAVEHPDDEYRLNTTGISLVQAIDEYSFLYIRFFGRGENLVRLQTSIFLGKE